MLQRFGMPPCPLQCQRKVEPRLWIAWVERSGSIKKVDGFGKLSGFQLIRALLAKRRERAAIFIHSGGNLGTIRDIL